MTAYLLPLLATAAAFALTYVFCMRPMLRGRGCAMTPPQPRAGAQASACGAATGSGASDSTDAEIKRLREEVQLLHHEVDLRSGTAEPAPADRLRKGEPR